MSNEYRHVELLTGDVRRRRWTTEQKLTIIEQSFEPGETVSSTARRHRVAPNLLHRTPKPRSGSSTDGSRITTKSIPIPRSRWLPHGSSSELNQTSRHVR